ncbi:MAG TPA: hypothetical protein VFU02_19125 [Polyangiaceae bacterium]|nr:hypothetical protein [Polyangiaceae bacterium]
MRFLRLAVLALAVMGCSSDPEESSSEKLRGKWMVELDEFCYLGATFNDGVYEVDVICSLESGGWGIEAELGSYGASDNTIDFVPEHASCFLPDRNYDPYTFSYSVNDDVLRLTTSGGLIMFDKFAEDPESPGPSGGAVARYGCAEESAFIFGEIAPVN